MKSFKINAFITLFVFSFTNQISAQWMSQISGTQQNLRSVSFIDSLKGWIVGDSGVILHTTNEGMVWTKQLFKTNFNLNSVSFCDSMNGWAVGYGGIVINTSDGGKNWNRVMHDTANNIRNTKVKCFDQNNVLISRIAWYGDYYGGGVLWNWKSDSSGTGWKDISPYSRSGLIFTVIDFEFVSENNGWVIKMDGLNFNWVPQVSKTTNGGYTWKSNQIPSAGYISFSDTSSGFLTDRSRVFTYVDSSNSFIPIDSLGFYAGESICRIGKIGYVSSDASIMKSTDGGIKWVKQSLNNGVTIYDIKFITPDIGWAVGNSGLIIHTVNGGVTSIRDDHTRIITFELEQNYPNPFNPSTQIDYQLPQSGFVSLVVYDLLGREITTLVSEENKPGKHSLQWNASQLASGVYYLKLQCGNNVLTEKMLLMK